jgi:CBS domain-containing protein
VGLSPPPIDIKKSVVGPLVRCLRTLALGCGISETNTLRRLEMVQAQGALPADLAEAVRSAYDFVMLLRIRHHFRQQEQGGTPDNVVSFKELNPLQGRFLVQSLYTIVEIEDYAKDRFGGVTVN